MKGESSRERRERGEGKHTQTEPCLTSSLTERTDTKPVRPSRREGGKEAGREGRGNKCKKRPAEENKGERDAQELHQFLYTRNKKHCVPEWELVSSTTGRVQ